MNAPAQYVFRREGEYWTIVFEGSVVRLRDSKGLRYLAQLLQRPGCKQRASELASSENKFARGEPDEVRARSAVTKRLRDAIRRIETHAPGLGFHLSTRIKTGGECVYTSNPGQPIEWECEGIGRGE